MDEEFDNDRLANSFAAQKGLMERARVTGDEVTFERGLLRITNVRRMAKTGHVNGKGWSKMNGPSKPSYQGSSMAAARDKAAVAFKPRNGCTRLIRRRSAPTPRGLWCLGWPRGHF